MIKVKNAINLIKIIKVKKVTKVITVISVINMTKVFKVINAITNIKSLVSEQKSLTNSTKYIRQGNRYDRLIVGEVLMMHAREILFAATISGENNHR